MHFSPQPLSSPAPQKSLIVIDTLETLFDGGCGRKVKISADENVRGSHFVIAIVPLIYDIPQFTDSESHPHNLPGLIYLGMVEGDVKYTLSGGQFVHGLVSLRPAIDHAKRSSGCARV
jgi:hypothetical protein